MQRKLNIGMIGAGFIGQLAHLMNYVEVRGCKVLGLAEIRPELRQKVAERYGIPRVYPSHHELLHDTDIEAVVVVTPRVHTAPIVLDCLEAGKHVMSEKPMAGTYEQGERLVKCASARKLHYAVGYMKRYDEGVQTAKRILDDVRISGTLGPILFARAHCYMGDSYCRADGHVVTDEKTSYTDGGWPMAPNWLPPESHRPYAAFVNTYSHNTNLLRYLFGKTPRVEYANLNRETAQITVLDFGGFAATVETGRASNRGWDEVTEVYFADGCLRIRTPPALLKNVPAEVELYRAGAIQEIITPQCNWTWSFRRQAEAFVNDVVEGKESINAGTDALEDLRLIEEMWRMETIRNNASVASGKN